MNNTVALTMAMALHGTWDPMFTLFIGIYMRHQASVN